MGKEEAKKKIAELVEKYKSLSQAELKKYNEAATKAGFIEPLFRALGWDTEDNNEVALEHNVSSKRVDYAFRINNVSKFYVEAKSLKAGLNNPEFIKQAVTYAYNKGVTWAVLTDFVELRIFNSQTGNSWINLECQDYETYFDKLWLLSKEALFTGLTDKEASQWGAMPAHVPIEHRLFAQLREWRGELLNQLRLYNKKLTDKHIDEIIQRLFNRLIFIRTSEDRKIEDMRLRAMVNQWKANKRKGDLIDELRTIFKEFDGYYDSELFANHLIDDSAVFIESDTLEKIIEGLYEIPGGIASYDFSTIDADVLGAVYEQYLGYVAQKEKQTAKGAQAVMDLGAHTENYNIVEKKQRRKEQGIYYTPKYITDYIVKETVGRFLTEHTAKENLDIKILDPACGSGSFLIRAFDELLKYYASQKVSKSEADIDAADRLAKLQNNIFGVDLDIKAVEIARLNLLLRSLAKREILPGLKNNIKEGNSLISGSEEELKKFFSKSWKEKNPFEWELEFRDIMDRGGFDVVIGNPPYVRSRNLDDLELEFFKNKFEVAHERFDIYTVFIQRGISLLNNGGRLGFIIPNKFLAAKYATKLRRFLLANCALEAVIDISNIGVFKEAAVYPCILIMRKEENETIRLNNMVKTFIANESLDINNTLKYENIPQNKLAIDENCSFQMTNTNEIRILISKIAKDSVLLGDIAQINEGIHTGNVRNKLIFKTPQGTNPKKVIGGKDVSRYSFSWRGAYVDYDASLIQRTQGEYGSLRDETIFNNPGKIVIRDIGLRPTAFLDTQQYYLLNTLYSLRLRSSSPDIRYVLGLINSNLYAFLFRNLYENAHIGGNFLRFKPFYLKQLPIHKIRSKEKTEKKIYDSLVRLVDKMQNFQVKYTPVRDDPFSERDELKKEIEKTDKEIDNLVYKLYGLTEAEIKIVEGTDSSQ
jgi:type I restriction-modification system DNA methylase subunit